MTTLGHKHQIKHPGYDPPGGFSRKDGFVFSSNIEDWMGKKKSDLKEKDRERKKEQYKPKRVKKNG